MELLQKDKFLDVLHCISGNHDVQQDLCSSCLKALIKFSILLLPWLFQAKAYMQNNYDIINKLRPIVAMDNFSQPKVRKDMYFNLICNYSCFFEQLRECHVEFRKMINCVTYIAILTIRLTLHINQIDLKFQQ